MICYATLGSNDLEKARAFYAALVAEIGGREVMRLDNGFTMYGTGRGQPTICVTKPYNGKAAVPGNGNMVAIVVKERAQVDALHAKALALGGTDEGAPGVRGEEGPQAFYGGYFRDLDGNKLGNDTVKKFRTTPEDRVRIELGDWKLTAPAAGTRDLRRWADPPAGARSVSRIMYLA